MDHFCEIWHARGMRVVRRSKAEAASGSDMRLF